MCSASFGYKKKKKNLPILVTNGFAAKFGYTLCQPLQM